MDTMLDFTQPCKDNSDLTSVKWIHGSISAKHNTDPDIQIHYHNDHTVILRQNMAVHYEAPFLFLLFGTQRAILLDTGATLSPSYFPLRQTVDELINKWLEKHHPAARDTDDPPYELVIAHTHLHRDHYEGDAQFENRPHTKFVEKTLEGTKSFYKFQNWPDDIPTYDLGGGRILHILATPGHEDAEVTIYDKYSQILFTGDLILPGRLYIRDWDAFISSLHRIKKFCESQSQTSDESSAEVAVVKYLVGCHIEMSIYPGEDYLIRTNYQPHEAPLPMTMKQLDDIINAATSIDGKAGWHRFDDFLIVFPVPGRYFAYENMDDDAMAGDVCQTCRLDREKKKKEAGICSFLSPPEKQQKLE